MYQRIYLRQPDAEERDLAIVFVTRPQPQGETTDDEEANEATNDEAGAEAGSVIETERWAQLAHAMLASNEFVFLD